MRGPRFSGFYWPVLPVVLGAFWFFVLMRPWQGLLDSDHAVPYLMTQTPWRLQDFYYWRAVRFGSLFVVFWKTLGVPVFRASAAPFYLTHALLFFAGLGFWLAALGGRTGRAIFFWTMLPLTPVLAYHFLLPGQLYGMVFFLMGAFFWTLVRGGNPLLLGILSGLLYWQHELAGLLCLAMAFAATRKVPDLAIGFLPGFAFAEVARKWAARWQVDKHYAFSSGPEILQSLVDLARRGLPFFGTRLQGYLFAICLVVVGLYAYRRKAEEGWEAASAVFFNGAIFCCGVIMLSHHYVDNGRSDRYFAFLVPATLFFLLKRAESLPRSTNARALVFMLALLVAANTHIRAGEWLTSRVNREAREMKFESGKAAVAALEKRGCRYFLAPYWDAYLLAPLSEGRILPSANDHIRNPEIHHLVETLPHCGMESAR